jgi:hypothetical protein
VSSSLKLSIIEILHLQPVVVPNSFLFAVSAPQRPVEQISYMTGKIDTGLTGVYSTGYILTPKTLALNVSWGLVVFDSLCFRFRF